MLDAQQRAIVAARLSLPRTSSGDRSGRLVSILAGMGAALVGAGILYLVGYNWSEFARGVKLALIFGVWLGLHVLAYRLARSPGRYPRLGIALIGIAVLSYGGAIGLIAQVYNLSAHYPWSIFAWWATSVPFVLLCESSLVLIVVFGLSLVWVFWHTGVYLGDAIRIHESAMLFAFALLGLGTAAFASAVGGACAATRFDKFRALLCGSALPLAIGAVYALSFRITRWDGEVDWFVVAGESIVPVILRPFAIAGSAACLALFASAASQRNFRSQRESLWIAVSGIAFALCTAWRPQSMYLLANWALLAAIVALVYTGVRRHRPAHINLGIAVFVVCLITRYCEYLWDKLSAAYAFIGLGVLLLAIGLWLEKRRKAWIASSRGARA